MRASPLPLVLSVVLIVMSSGCTLQTTQTGNGVVIEEFNPGFKEVYPDEPVQFFLKFKNKGSIDAKNVFAELVGLDEDWAESSSGISGNVMVGSEILPRETQCRYTSGGNQMTLAAPNPIYGTEGESGTCTWVYKTPDIPEGTGTKYDVTARVFYDYDTNVIKSFTIAPAQELMRHNEQKKTLPTSTISSSRSPISITAKARDPIRFYNNDKVSFPLEITVSNKGGGMVCLLGKCKKESGNEWNKLSLRIDPQSTDVKVSTECSEYTGSITPGTAISVADYTTRGVVEVWPKKDNTIVCNIEVTGLSKIVGFQERLIEITAKYSYFVDKAASITII